jgi:hypothetical protein
MLFCDLHDVASKNEIFKQKGQTCMRQVCRWQFILGKYPYFLLS